MSYPQIFLSQEILTQKYGANPQNYIDFDLNGHEGDDFKPKGITWGVHAAEDGTVILDDDIDGGARKDAYGIQVRIMAPSGRVTCYAHLSENCVSIGDKIKAGQLIGVMGNTGRSKAPHVHFMVYYMLNGIRLYLTNGFKGLLDPKKETWPIWRVA